METRRERERGQSTRGQAPGEQAQATAREGVGKVAEAARDVAQTRAQTFFESGKGAAVSTVGAVANALRNAASELEGRQQQPLAGYARRAADRIERFSHDLERRDLTASLHSAEEFARREPALFLGGAFVAGVTIARFLKASGARSRNGGQSGTWTGGEMSVPTTTPGAAPIPPVAPY